MDPPEEGPPSIDYDWNPKICGICGQDKIKLTTTTQRRQLEVWVCTNIPKRERLACDGFAYKVHVFSRGETDGDAGL